MKCFVLSKVTSMQIIRRVYLSLFWIVFVLWQTPSFKISFLVLEVSIPSRLQEAQEERSKTKSIFWSVSGVNDLKAGQNTDRLPFYYISKALDWANRESILISAETKWSITGLARLAALWALKIYRSQNTLNRPHLLN